MTLSQTYVTFLTMDDATFNDLIQIYYEDDNALRHLWRKYMNRQWNLPPGVTNNDIDEYWGDDDEPTPEEIGDARDHELREEQL